MEKVIIGIIRKAHGLKGHLKAGSMSGETGHFLSLKKISIKLGLQEREYEVEEVKPFGTSDVLLKLKGIDNPETAKLLSTGKILVPREQAAPLKKGEVYQSDLLGCQVVKDSLVLGRVTDVFEGAQSDLLEVKTETGSYLVPFMKNYIGKVDVKEKNIELLADWLLQ